MKDLRVKAEVPLQLDYLITLFQAHCTVFILAGLLFLLAEQEQGYENWQQNKADFQPQNSPIHDDVQVLSLVGAFILGG